FSQQYEEGETATLIAIPHAGYNFVNWTEDGAEVSTGIVLSFTVTHARSLVANFDYGTAISELNSNTKFIVYPNPANELIHIIFDKYDLNSDNVEIVLYDLSGKTYRIDNFSIDQNKMSLNVSDRAPGIYFIQMIINGEKVETAKVKIMR
ncbi:MAG: T9SS C-terminal target domain-containing protein, partial [Bacteroidetes bacterium]